mmetsp:Transcript_40141/g.75264  ORF Transcript_40141/g.75264 Transcript_40141/m.75264 type:complete len:341 (-) Transcript_40141:471-1493(-)
MVAMRPLLVASAAGLTLATLLLRSVMPRSTAGLVGQMFIVTIDLLAVLVRILFREASLVAFPNTGLFLLAVHARLLALPLLLQIALPLGSRFFGTPWSGGLLLFPRHAQNARRGGAAPMLQHGVQPNQPLQKRPPLIVRLLGSHNALVRIVERHAHLLRAVGVARDVVGSVARVLHREQERPVLLEHLALLLAVEAPAVLHADPHLLVVHFAPVELQEFKQQQPKVVIQRLRRVGEAARVHEEVPDDHREQGVRPNASSIHLVQLALLQKNLQHQGYGFESHEGLHLLHYPIGRRGTIGNVEADIKLEAALLLHKLHNGHLGLGNHLHVGGHVAAVERVG